MKILFSIIACSFFSILGAQNCNESQAYCESVMPADITYNIYGQCLYLKPLNNNLYYGAEAIALNPDLSGLAALASPDWTILEIKPDYQFGFDIGANMIFDHSNMDIDLNWERLHSEDSNSFENTDSGVMVGPFFDIGPNSSSYQIANGKIKSRFDKINLSFGKQIFFCDDLYARFFGGVSFLRIEESFHNNYSNVEGTISRYINTSSNFSGVGPQFGVDYKYLFCNDFSFTGTSAVCLLMGKMKNSASYQSSTPLAPQALPQPNEQSTTIPNRDQLIPGFEQKLGISYLATWECLKVTFEIGYQCQIYLNAVQTFDMSGQAVPNTIFEVPDVGMFALSYEQNNHNYMLAGPYVSVKFEF